MIFFYQSPQGVPCTQEGLRTKQTEDFPSSSRHENAPTHETSASAKVELEPPFPPFSLSLPLSPPPSFLASKIQRWRSLPPNHLDGLLIFPPRIPPTSPDPFFFLLLLLSLSIVHSTSLRSLHSSILRSSLLPSSSENGLPSTLWIHSSSRRKRSSRWRWTEISCFPKQWDRRRLGSDGRRRSYSFDGWTYYDEFTGRSSCSDGFYGRSGRVDELC